MFSCLAYTVPWGTDGPRTTSVLKEEATLSPYWKPCNCLSLGDYLIKYNYLNNSFIWLLICVLQSQRPECQRSSRLGKWKILTLETRVEGKDGILGISTPWLLFIGNVKGSVKCIFKMCCCVVCAHSWHGYGSTEAIVLWGVWGGVFVQCDKERTEKTGPPLFLCGAVKVGLKLGPQGRTFNRELSFPASILITVGFKVDGQPA